MDRKVKLYNNPVFRDLVKVASSLRNDKVVYLKKGGSVSAKNVIFNYLNDLDMRRLDVGSISTRSSSDRE